jgi:hypothetical protein
MAILTLAEAQKHFNDPVAAGVADTLIKVDPMFEVIPAIGIAGSSVTVNQETTKGAASWYSTATTDLIDATHNDYSGANASTARTFTLHPVVGQAMVTKFHQATSAAAGVDQLAMQIASKARNIGRMVRESLVATVSNAPAGLNQFAGVGGVAQPSDTDIFECLDALLDAVSSKDGQVDALLVNEEVMRAIRRETRQANQNYEFWTSPVSGQDVLSYNGVPIFRNQYIAAETAPTGDQSDIYAVNFEDGGNNGLALIYPDGTNAGIEVNVYGESEIYHAETARVSQICGWALYNDNGVKKMTLDTTSIT